MRWDKIMIFRLTTALLGALTFAAISSPYAFAQRLCGSKVEQNSSVARLLETGSKTHCAINTEKSCSIDFTATAPKECKASEVFSFRRTAKSKRWSIVLESLTDLPDLERMAITVDNNDPLEMPAEFLSHGPKKLIREVHIDPRLTQTIITAFQNAKKVSLKVTYGKKQTYTSQIDSDTLKGFGRALKWVNCMQLME